MQHRPLGSTGISVSAIAFGAGPVSGLMTGGNAAMQRAVIARAIDAGVNWFDTAATYGQGASERNLGETLATLGALDRVHIATKVRLSADDLDDLRGAVRRSVEQSIARLGVERVTLLQLHNPITANRGDEPTSVTPGDVLDRGGVLDAMRGLRREGAVRHLGLTGIGQPEAMREVIRSGQFQTIQIPYHLLNPSAGMTMSAGFNESDYGNVIEDAAQEGMGVFAIRVFAGGALAGQPPSAHTRTTPFFPLDLYERDQRRAAALDAVLAGRLTRAEVAQRFVLGDGRVSSAIVGFGDASHVEEAIRWADAGPLPDEILEAAARVR